MLFVGIDPGASGGLAAIDDEGSVVMARPLRDLSRWEILEFLRDCKQYDKTVAFCERVGVHKGEGPLGAFTFGRHAERVEFALQVMRIPFDLVDPKMWQLLAGLAYPKQSKRTEKKNLGKARAELLYDGQGLTITHALADALLIAEACRRNMRGQTPKPRGSGINGEKTAATPRGPEGQRREGQAAATRPLRVNL
jgi:hypothetical protein